MSQGPEEVAEFLATVYVFAEQLRSEYEHAAAYAGLTTQQAIVLTLLSAPMPMRSIAERRRCDPSNITGIVDRLEEKDLVERSADPSDRRIKRVSLTRAGRDTLARFHSELAHTSSLGELTSEQRQRLLDALPEIKEQEG